MPGRRALSYKQAQARQVDLGEALGGDVLVEACHSGEVEALGGGGEILEVASQPGDGILRQFFGGG